MEHDTVRIPSPQEMETFLKDQDILEAHVRALTDEEKDKVFDMGYHNNTVKGYMVLAMEAAGLDKAAIENALAKSDKILKDVSAVDARAAFSKF